MQTITHNLQAQFTKGRLSVSTKEKSKSAEKLASGYRINRSADDAAGLQISEKMRWQIRGLGKASTNIQDGVSLLQLADGALSEVHNMLDRMKELSVQAANDTNTQEDRAAIQQELDRLIVEIDRIGSDTEYNTLKIFQGGSSAMVDSDGNRIDLSDIPFEDLQLARVDLGNYPFKSNSNGNDLNLVVSTVSGYTEKSWNLIFGNGSTSHSGVRVTYQSDDGNPVTEQCALEDMDISSVSISDDGRNCSRTFSYDFGDGVKLDIVQEINVGDNDTIQQYYNFDHYIINTGEREASIEFMFNVDSAYNNDDRCEEYFIDGQKVDNFCLYTNNPAYASQNSAYIYDISSFPANADGFSIIDSDNALPFSETICWTTAPDTISIGNWSLGTGSWDYYNNLNSKLGGSTENKDMSFSLMWNQEDLTAGDSYHIKFDYGIIEPLFDPNLDGVNLDYEEGFEVHTNRLDLWIQSGAKNKSGQFISIEEMNSVEIGLTGLDVTTFMSAGRAISSVEKAIELISAQRSNIGAQQNRLEYAMRIDDNTAENSQNAESRIRDTEMAAEMVNYVEHNILEQTGQSLLAQINRNPQTVLSLLQS